MIKLIRIRNKHHADTQAEENTFGSSLLRLIEDVLQPTISKNHYV